MALGSLILAFLQTLKYILRYLVHEIRNVDPRNKAIRICKCLFGWLISCFEHHIHFISFKSYVQTSLTGTNFCNGSKDSYYLLHRNVSLFAISHGVCESWVWFGRSFIISVTTLCGWILIHQEHGENLKSIWAPITIIFIISWVVGSMFMSIWGIGADAILQCLCIDKELNSDRLKMSVGAAFLQGKQASNYCPMPLLNVINDPEYEELISTWREEHARKVDEYNK